MPEHILPVAHSRAWRGLKPSLALIVIASSASVFFFIASFGTNVPIGDDWDLLRTLLAWRLDPITFASIVAFHNEHRIIATRLLFAALLPLVDGDVKVAMLFNAALVVVTLGVLATFFTRARTHAFFAIFGFAAVASLVAGWFQWQNLLWSFQLPWLLLPLILVVALWTIGNAERDRTCVLVVVALMVMALCCQANGLIVGLSIVPAALIRKRAWSKRRRAALAGVMVLACVMAGWIYFLDLPPYVARPAVGAVIDQPWLFTRFLVSAVGSPFSAPLAWQGPERWIGVTAGWCSIVATALVLVVAWRDRRHDDRYALKGFAVGLIVFGAASLGAVSLGRFQAFSPDAIESRYTTLALYFHAGTLMTFFLLATRARPVGPATGLMRLSLLLVCAGTIAAANWGDALFLQLGLNLNLAQSRYKASLQLSTALPDRPELAGEIHTVPVAKLQELLAALEDHRLWTPVRWTTRSQAELENFDASGNVDDESAADGLVTLRGWARLPNDRPADAVLAMVRDADERFVPVAISAAAKEPRPDVVARFAASDLAASGWKLDMKDGDYRRRPVIVAYSAADERLYVIPFMPKH